ncbi:MAG TPA: TlpA disulfide reductase family protein [Gaiellaceae bacterium]|jgi:thiol-disulfide isomerase/thioredoxin
MGKAARNKQQRRVAPPPPVGKNAATRPPARMVWFATSGLVAVLVVGGIIYSTTRSSPKTAPPAANVSSSDASASNALISAAQAVGFHPTTEAGVGTLEDKPASAAQAPANANLLAVGTFAPAFTLETPQGQKIALTSFRGHATLLEFFATWCPHCNAEEPHLAPMARALQSKGIRFLAVNADGETAPSVYAFHRYYGMTYPALVDPSSQPGSFNQEGGPGQVSTVYKVEAFPTFYVLDKTGKITWRSDGEQPDALLKQELLKAEAGA